MINRTVEHKVDELYRALAIDDQPIVILSERLLGKSMAICRYCHAKWTAKDRLMEIREHVPNCIYAEAIEYVDNKPKATTDER